MFPADPTAPHYQQRHLERAASSDTATRSLRASISIRVPGEGGTYIGCQRGHLLSKQRQQ